MIGHWHTTHTRASCKDCPWAMFGGREQATIKAVKAHAAAEGHAVAVERTQLREIVGPEAYNERLAEARKKWRAEAEAEGRIR